MGRIAYLSHNWVTYPRTYDARHMNPSTHIFFFFNNTFAHLCRDTHNSNLLTCVYAYVRTMYVHAHVHKCTDTCSTYMYQYVDTYRGRKYTQLLEEGRTDVKEARCTCAHGQHTLA